VGTTAHACADVRGCGVCALEDAVRIEQKHGRRRVAAACPFVNGGTPPLWTAATVSSEVNERCGNARARRENP
jgi:hypothetical protein